MSKVDEIVNIVNKKGRQNSKKKFQVVRCDSIHANYYVEEERKELGCEILGTFDCHKSAVEFMGNAVDKNHEQLGGWIRIYHDNCDSISVFHCGIVGGKYLICKYHILEYTE